MDTQGDRYMLHNFDDEPNLNYLGTAVPGITSIPILHMYSATLSVHGGNDPLPPKGIFDWHYLQCVLLRFGTSDYKHLPNITFSVYPFKTADDESEEDFENDIYDSDEPPYPSYHLDRFMRQQWEKYREQERFKAIAKWSSEVTSNVV